MHLGELTVSAQHWWTPTARALQVKEQRVSWKLLDSLLSALPFAHPSCLPIEPSPTRVLGKWPCISSEVRISGLGHLDGLGFVARAEELSAPATNPHILNSFGGVMLFSPVMGAKH